VSTASEVEAKQGPSTDWWEWRSPEAADEYSIGIEEEVMLLDPQAWSLAHRIETVLPRLPSGLAKQTSAETQGSALELQTGVHDSVGEGARELRELRATLTETLDALGLRAAVSGTHPFATWQESVVSEGERYQEVYGSMRELARREPTFALHVHVGIRDPEDAIRAANRMRVHLPMLLALSGNSPFWQGRDTGLASARTPLFQAFPRVGVPRPFDDYTEWVETVDLLIRAEAIPEATFLWWDVRLQPQLGTLEVRIMDAQTRIEETMALAALVQSLVRLEVRERYVAEQAIHSPEVISENRFIAARDGSDCSLIDCGSELRIPLERWLDDVLQACGPHAEELGCARELAQVSDLAERNGADRQIAIARDSDRMPDLVAALADDFCRSDSAG
jgi:carboxylate-amine ligase